MDSAYAIRERQEKEARRDDIQPTQSANARKKKRGETMMAVGGVLLGLGILVFAIAALAITFNSIPAMVMGTVGALMGIGGLVVLIIGAAFYSRAS
jgi:hypothetical protein